MWWACLGVCVWAIAAHTQAATPATERVVENMARMTYFDTGRGFDGLLFSNTVLVTVPLQQGLSLVAPLQLSLGAGNWVDLPHTLTNTGSVSSSYVLNINSAAGADYALGQLRLVWDRNGNGVADIGEPLLADGATVGPLAPGESLQLIVEGLAPATARIGQSAQVDLRATTATPGQTSVVTAALSDRITIAAGAVLRLSKSASINTAKPGDVVRYTLIANSIGDRIAQGVALQVDGQPQRVVLLRDAVPANTSLAAMPDASAITSSVPLNALVLVHVQGQPDGQWQSRAPPLLMQVDAVAFAWPDGVAPGVSVRGTFAVRVNDNAGDEILNTAQGQFSDNLRPDVQTANSNTVRLVLPPHAAVLRLFSDAAYTQAAAVLSPGSPLYVALDAAGCNSDPSRVETVQMSISTTVAGDSESYSATETAPNSGVFRIEPQVPTTDATTGKVTRGDGAVSAGLNDHLIVNTSCGHQQLQAELVFDPFGVVFDSKNNQPVAGATVTLLQNVAAAPSSAGKVHKSSAQPLVFTSTNVVTGDDGRYRFAAVPAGVYQLMVRPPARFAFPSVVAESLLSATRRVQDVVSYGKPFRVGLGEPPVSVDVPVDHSDVGAFYIEKTASASSVEVGDVVDYRIKITNQSGALMGNVQVADQLPVGFAYQRFSAGLGTLGQKQARLDGSALPEPDGGAGPALNFHIGSIADQASIVLNYRLRVGAAALKGDGVNSAQARSLGPVNRFSNTAHVKVKVLPGVFDARGYVVGNVYADCNRNQQRDPDEPGIPGVRLYLEDGTHVTTDANGRFSLYGLRPTTHVLKLDETTMPFAGIEGKVLMALLANRQGGDAATRFIDLKNGEMQRADFAVAGCSDAQREAITTRGATFNVDGESADADRLTVGQLTADPRMATVADPKALPASGVVGGVAAAARGNRNGADATAPTAKAVAALALPKLDADQLATFDSTLAFVFPLLPQTLGAAQTGVVIKGPLDKKITLKVNGKAVAESRIGRRLQVTAQNLQVLEYVGVNLRAGANELTIEGEPTDTHIHTPSLVLVAPGALAKLRLTLPSAPVPADPKQLVRMLLEVLDANGVKVTSPTPITLSASLGRWTATDLDAKTAGVQIFVEGGEQWLALQAPADPGTAQLSAASGDVHTEANLSFVPALRPLIAVGVVDGVLSLNRLNPAALQAARQQDGFEDELQVLSKRDGAGGASTALTGRSAVYLKGTVSGDVLLTLAYDSNKSSQQALFRDIQPSEHYPVYGDASVKGFDAQSTSRLYVRLDRGPSFVLYGDFNTQAPATTTATTTASTTPGNTSGSTPQERRLGQYNRSLNGAQGHAELAQGQVALDAFASRTRSRQVVDELASLGTSGPYFITRLPLVENSERVELVTRDSNQNTRLLRSVVLTRFVDYEVDVLSGRIVLAVPLPGLDAALNPNSLRVTYETDAVAQEAWVAGVAGRAMLSNEVAVAANVVHDSDPQKPMTLASASLLVRPTPQDSVVAEVAGTRTPLASLSDKSNNGKAVRVALRHDSASTQVQAQLSQTSAGFDNPNAGVTAGQTEGSLQGTVKLDEHTTLKADALVNVNNATAASREGASLGLAHVVNDMLRVDMALRYTHGDGGAVLPSLATAAPTDNSNAPNAGTSLLAKLSTSLPDVPRTTAFAELEQDLRQTQRYALSVGGDYRMESGGRLYVRHELASTLSSRYDLNPSVQRNATVLGVQADVLQDAHVFSEYRLREALDGRAAEAALGLRKQWRLGTDWAFNTGFERVHALTGAVTASENTAVTAGAQYTGAPDWKAAARLEARRSSTSENYLSTTGVAWKLNREWTALAKTLWSVANTQNALHHQEISWQAGVAYRQAGANHINALMRFEDRYEDSHDATGQTADVLRHVAVLSGHLNVEFRPGTTLSGRYAGKRVIDNSSGLNSHENAQLFGLRVTQDLGAKFDLGVHSEVWMGGSNSAIRSNRQQGLGLELGYQLVQNLWVSGGINVFGFTDADLSGQDHTARGFYVRMRFKFDEATF